MSVADAALVTGAELITKALLRRLNTPYSGYRRLVRQASGLVELDTSYGNRAFDYLSAPSTPGNIYRIEQATRAAAEQEPRIQVLDLKAQLSSDFVTVDVVLKYRILSTYELQVLNLQLNS